MSKFYFLFLFTSLSLTACFGGKSKSVRQNLNPEKQNKIAINNRCIQDRFAQGHDENLYGINCINEKALFIKTNTTGDLISTSRVNRKENSYGVRIGEGINFKNKIYKANYQLLEKEGDDKDIPFLKDFLPKNEDFFGFLDKKYRIVFETKGNYLILFKASKDLNDLPYVERTSAIKSKDQKYYMVPFIGYPIQYCNPEVITNTQNEETYENRASCQNFQKSAKYIRIQTANKQVYKYKEKKDLFPSDYFQGEWFFSIAPIEQASQQGNSHLTALRASSVKLNKKSNHLEIIDISGDIEKRNRLTLHNIPITWVEYEMNQNGSHFETFGERNDTSNEAIKRSHLQINFQKLIEQGDEVIDLLITKDYFSYVTEIQELDPKTNQTFSSKIKLSLLRKTAVDTKNFKPKKWFIEDHNFIFGILPTIPQTERKVGQFTKEEIYDKARMIRFNTSLNTDQEKKEKTKTIKWYFSKNSTKNPEYRSIARKAVQVWNKAFQFITQNSDQKIKVVLIEDEGDKELGDLRYNIINLTDNSSGSSSLLGIAPSYIYQDTGQIIGATSNILLNGVLDFYSKKVRDYIRYEIFQKKKKTEEENTLHVVSPHIREKLHTYCPEVNTFIREQLKNANLKPRNHLEDTDLILSCVKTAFKDSILNLILHEMGHNFGLSHNFRGSTDQDNYYHSVQELNEYFPEEEIFMEKISKSSSIMDYLPMDIPLLTVLGKYDLATLKFLYLDQIENKEGKVLSLNSPEDPSKQKSLYLNSDLSSQRKNYAHCPDNALEGVNIFDAGKNDFLCLSHDYGSNPSEIVHFYIQTFKQALSTRYVYDEIPDERRFLYKIIPSLIAVLGFNNKWLQVRDKYLQSIHKERDVNYVINKSSVEGYKNLLKSGLETNNTEYKSYYAIRDSISNFLMNLLLTPSMTCTVKDSDDKEHVLNLESITKILQPIYNNQLYIEDCHSDQVAKFFNEKDLTLIKQKGVELHYSYYPEGTDHKVDIFSLLYINYVLADKFSMSKPFNKVSFLQEIDMADTFRLKLEEAFLIGKGKSARDLETTGSLYFKEFISMLYYKNGEESHFEENRPHWQTIKYLNGTGSQSFYKNVQEPLNNKAPIETIHVPFLTQAYKNYQKISIPNKPSFQDYIKQSKNIIKDQHSIIIPFKLDGYIAKVIEKYNQNLKQIEYYDNLEKERGLTDIEKILRAGLITHNLSLKKASLTVENNN